MRICHHYDFRRHGRGIGGETVMYPTLCIWAAAIKVTLGPFLYASVMRIISAILCLRPLLSL